ncbi:MAG: hypothetical protein KKH68_03510 [Proteobacteria bacterium]|nr:hypothetical protein [Pseudomonadota bacterium]
MIKYFTNRELARRLEINLAKWKRWSREFLPPDPLGGMQSGYAQQYNPDQAFTVYLGGHLVAELKFTIPDSKQILENLKGWLAGQGFFFKFNANAVSKNEIDALVKKYILFIRKETGAIENKADFFFTARGIISNRPVSHQGFEVIEELYVETTIGLRPDPLVHTDSGAVKKLNISAVLENFVLRLELDRAYYPALSKA